jgi:putative PIN family toxin of toxin-antitoxin system
VAIRAVIDTNIWVSALLNPFGFPATLRRFFAEGAFQSVISESILLELAEVLNRPRIKDKYGLTVEDIRELIILIEERSEHVMLSGDVSVCRDKDDNLIIETALKGQAQYIVTRDDDIKFDNNVSLFLAKHGITVSSVAQFLSITHKE